MFAKFAASSLLLVSLLASAGFSSSPTVLIRIHQRPPQLVNDNSAREFSNADFETFKKTQSALIRSNFVIRAVLRNPEIASLPSVTAHANDPIGWLADKLKIDFPGNAEILSLTWADDNRTAAAPEISRADISKILNAVAHSYISEIVDAERQARLKNRNLIEKTLVAQRQDLRSKMNQLHELNEKLGKSPAAEIRKQLSVKSLKKLSDRRDRLQNALDDLTLKSELDATSEATAKPAHNLAGERDVYQRHIAALDKRIEEQLVEIQRMETYSTEAEARRKELAVLQESTDRLARELKLSDMNLEAAPRIAIIDQATAD